MASKRNEMDKICSIYDEDIFSSPAIPEGKDLYHYLHIFLSLKKQDGRKRKKIVKKTSF